jgi:F-type H+-transporting ATPase subunit a
MSADIFDYVTRYPLKKIGLEGDFWGINIDILIATWVAMGIMLVLILIGRHYLNRGPNLVSMCFEQTISIFSDLCKESLPSFNYHYFAFIASIFFFTFFCCLVGILPFLKEATKDLNTTLAIGLTSFLYVQYQKINVHGVGGYLKEFAEPFFLLIPIHIVGELSKIASMSFRLFGNILGGAVILDMVRDDLFGRYKIGFMIFTVFVVIFSWVTSLEKIGPAFPRLTKISSTLLSILFLFSWLQIGLGIGEGLIQSFVVTMLTLTYLAIGTYQEPTHEHKEAT